MGAGETGTPTKAAAGKGLTAQEAAQAATPPLPTAAVPPAVPPPTSYPEWAAAFQAYYSSGGQPPPGYFPPSAVSGPPQPHPFMWGGQPMLPPPYGAPPPSHQTPYGVYPHGGMYPHPSMFRGAHAYGQFGMPSPGGASEAAPGMSMAAPGVDADMLRGAGGGATEPTATKEASPLKMRGSLGSLGMQTSKGGGEGGKGGNNNSANGVFSQSSGESGSDGSSEGSDEDNSQTMLRKRSFDQIPTDGSGGQLVSVGQGSTAGSGKGTSGGPTTNLGIGIQDYWSGGSSQGAVSGSGGGKPGKRTPGSTSSGGMGPAGSQSTAAALAGGGSGGGLPPELWLQDEREVKRQRRKQSNRESARRSRLRKQAECEELSTRVDTLTVENMALRAELARMSEDYKRLTSDHSSLREQLRKYRVEDGSSAPKQCEDDKLDAVPVLHQPDGNGKVDELCHTGGPDKRQLPSSREEESSLNSPGKLPAALDDEARPETILQTS